MKLPTPAPVCIVGAACRLPGAPDEAAFRDVLNQGRFTVGDLPAGRWRPDLLFHPDTRAPGSAYTFKGGYLADPYGFDIGAFGMSPREAAQVDPQQRILAEVVWEALEDARIAPTAVAGKEVGVYIGVSALDHANLFGGDPGGIESHFMTGNTLSIVANRISYLFDLKGPSFIVDTACSSSLVAVDRALADLNSGRIDTAIVGGVNMLLSPASFVGFSRASMLSPTGACRPFSGEADGYVRAEGAVAFVLQRQDAAAPGSVRALITGSAVNSDGRTSGIALPGLDGQRRLLEHAYRSTDFALTDLDFVEAHGTGTAVGDPIEATAIGEVLGRGRTRPLPIGSVKSNIGHLEPASGVAGMLKALIAMEQRVLPATLHLATRNSYIDFDKLNLAPAAEPVPLGSGTLRCGVSSFGFGGTNAHIVMASAPALTPFEAWQSEPEALTISAHCKEALASLAGAYADRLDLGADPGRLAEAVARGRSLLRHRAVVALDEAGAMADSLRAFAGGKAPAGNPGSGVIAGSAPPGATQVCFVYNGNGSQWVGMGRAAHAANETFCRAFEQADRAFGALGCESLTALMQADDLGDRLGSAAVAQPLIYAIQVGITAALSERGLRPAFVLGHSVGEIAAAWAAGIIRLEQGARIVMARATSQEAIHGSGGMATLGGERATVAKLIATQGLDVAIAAENGPASVTVSGAKPQIAALMKAARRQRIAGVQLDIEYPYHSPLLDGIKGHFLAEVGMIASSQPRIAMVSTVTGEMVAAERLDEAYWWRNIREEVLFRTAVRTAAEHGANLFVEIGPRAILNAATGASVEDAGLSARVLVSLGEGDKSTLDPIAATVNRAVANGFDPAAKDAGPLRRARVDRTIPLAPYPWQRREHRHETTAAAIDIHGMVPRHPTIGARLMDGSPEWRTVLDAQLVPYLADHVVGGEVVLPATALAEMALAAARDLWPAGPLALLDFDIVQALVLPADGQREVSVRYGEAADTIEIYSRRRLTADEWTLAARGRIARADADAEVAPAPAIAGEPVPDRTVETVYAGARRCGIEYGPEFRLLTAIERDEDSVIEETLAVPDRSDLAFAKPHVIDPASLDASLHGLFDLIDRDDEEGKAWLPIRFERLLLLRDQPAIAGATLFVEKSNAQLKVLTIWLRDAGGEVVAKLDRVLLRAVYLSRRAAERGLYHLAERPAGLLGTEPRLLDAVRAHLAASALPAQGDARLLLRAHMRSVADAALRRLVDGEGRLDPVRLVATGCVAQDALPLLRALMGELASADLIAIADGVGTFATDTPDALPDPELILATFAAEHPLASVDLALAARAAATLDASLAEGPSEPRTALVERAAQASDRFDAAAEVLSGCVDALVAEAGAGMLHLVVAEHGSGALVTALADRAARGVFRLSVAAAEAGAAERARRRYAGSGIEVIDSSERPVPSADAVLAIRQADGVVLPADLGGLLHEGGVLLAASLRADTLDVFHGTAPTDVREAALPADLDEARRTESQDGHLAIWTARRRSRAVEATTAKIAWLAADDARSQALLARLAAAVGTGQALEGADHVVYLLDPDDAPGRLPPTIEALRSTLIALRETAPHPIVWVAATARADNSAGLAAIRAFVRVAMNEMADLDLRFLAIDEAAGDAGDFIARRIADRGLEREVSAASGGQQVARLETGLPLGRAPYPHAEAAHLQFARPGMLDAFEWAPATRRAPGADEVEVAVAATGLNFRDVMLALGLLSDDVLDEGLAGAVYGLECAGTVVRVGKDVTAHRVGDVVFGFGMDSFRSHVVGHEQSFVPLPEGLPAAAAAAVPVAFYTAWYSLVELARLQPGETVLVHGGAGGVGLAAIQIASVLGAEVIATVSSPDKEALARLYGAAHVYNSRSLAFADRVAEHHGGVDVVLNSLSGEAMRASIRCLKPRGRFVELGKRDYVANSMVGLRPFRRNLSYFGVDVDQLLALDPAMTVKGLEAIREGFADGSYLPLPVTAFRADEVGEAFRLMQSAGHVGKIVVAPAVVETVAPRVASAAFVPGEGVQLIVGGTRGFGLATAMWLAGRGATRIVVASRAGKLDAAGRAAVRALGPKVRFAVEKVDVTDADDVAALVARVVATYGPITGVYHTAVTLKDAMLDAIAPEDLTQVLAPKAVGAANLDAATRGQPVAQFVLYSSVSALVGNPGQGAYAAANGYLEGLARARRAAGLPALAVQWGAIGDVGLLADRQDTLESLARVSGIQAMDAADALERLGAVLAQADSFADPVVAIADFASSGAIHALPVPSSPAFAPVFATRASAIVEAGVDLAALIADKSEAEAQRLLAALMAEEVAQILRLAVQDIDLDGSIDGLGMDSLMALELRMSIETRYRIELPVMAITAAGSLRELAHRVLAIVRQDGSSTPQSPVSEAESALITMHGGKAGFAAVTDAAMPEGSGDGPPT
jgi:acyl transferase domain-containing protein/acyl carrier protein